MALLRRGGPSRYFSERATPETVGALFRPTPSGSKGLVPEPDDGRSGAKRQLPADAVDDEKVAFHADIDERLRAVAEDVEDRRHFAVVGEPQVREPAVVEDERRNDVVRPAPSASE
jgi:hypothetical protein